MTAHQAIVTLGRHRGIGGSDAMRIMAGDWATLYREKVGEAEPADLSDVFKVQLGIRTESFHAEWFAKRTGFTLRDPAPFYEHGYNDFMFAHLDRWIVGTETFVELKHSRQGANARAKAQYYMPQLQHYMAVTGVWCCWFSVIPGNDEPDFCVVDRDEAYIEALIEAERSFWWHVTQKVPPDIIPTAPLKAAAKQVEKIAIDQLRTYDMTTSNEWADVAARFINLKPLADSFEEAKSRLKMLLPEDAADAYGHGVVVRRDRANRISIKQKD